MCIRDRDSTKSYMAAVYAEVAAVPGEAARKKSVKSPTNIEVVNGEKGHYYYATAEGPVSDSQLSQTGATAGALQVEVLMDAAGEAGILAVLPEEPKPAWAPGDEQA